MAFPPPPGPTSASSPLGFSAPKTFGDGVTLAFKRHGALLLVALAFMIPGTLVALLAGETAQADLQGAIIQGSFSSFLTSPTALILIASVVLSYLGGVALQGVLALAAYQQLRDGRFNIIQCINQTLSRALPLIGACLLQGLLLLLIFAATGVVMAYVVTHWSVAIVGALIALVVYIRLYVIVPSAVVENIGGATALTRSTALTAGRRWSVFGLLLLLVVATIVIGIIEALIASLVQVPAVLIIISIYTSLLVAVFNGLFAGLTYFGLRGEKEGISLAGLERVFD